MKTRKVAMLHYRSFLPIALALFALLFSSVSHSRTIAYVTWKVAGGPSYFSGQGKDRADALLYARFACEGTYFFKEEYRLACRKKPLSETYSEIPDGSYYESCDQCRVENNKLICGACKPKIERREINLSNCTAEWVNRIENCSGDLTCGPCPSRNTGKTTLGCPSREQPNVPKACH